MIDLGSKISAPEQSVVDEPYYPTIHLSDSEAAENLPDEGTMTVKFKVTRREEVKDKHGERYNCCIEIRAIESIDGKKCCDKKKKDKFEETGDVLDKLRAMIAGEKED